MSISSLLWLCLLACSAGLGLAGKILAIITPGCQSHLLGQRKIIVELARRGHDVMVSALYISCSQQKAIGISIERAPAIQVIDHKDVWCCAVFSRES